MKYIIKNCPNCWTYNRIYFHPVCGLTYQKGGFKEKTENFECCKDISDYLLKRIVELCDNNASKVLYEGETSKILELLEIEECEDE